jgi:hypothetical protein
MKKDPEEIHLANKPNEEGVDKCLLQLQLTSEPFYCAQLLWENCSTISLLQAAIGQFPGFFTELNNVVVLGSLVELERVAPSQIMSRPGSLSLVS